MKLRLMLHFGILSILSILFILSKFSSGSPIAKTMTV